MSRYQIKRQEDGRGPYRWAHVIKSPRGELQHGTIYHQLGDDLDAADAQTLRSLCDTNGFELRRVA